VAAHRVILGRARGLSRPALQESAKQICQPLVPAVFKVPRACVGVLVIQRPHDPLDVLFLDIEYFMTLSDHNRAPGVIGEKSSHWPRCYVRRDGGKVTRL